MNMKIKSKITALLALIVMSSSVNIIKAEGSFLTIDQSAVYPNPEVPMAVVIAGEQVLFDRIDMYERLDREITQIIYGHSNLLLTIKRANRYFPLIIPILKKNGIPEDFAYLAAVESYLNVNARSPAGAAGIWQLMKGTARDYGLEVNDEVDERYDPVKSTEAACKYLKAAFKKYRHWPTVAASYNAGMGRISKELDKQFAEDSFDLFLNEETSRYVFRFIAMKLIIEQPQKYGFQISKQQLYQPVKYKEKIVNGIVGDWIEWAKSQGITYAQLRSMNPWIRSSSMTKSKRKHIVYIPLEESLYRSKMTSISVYNKNWVVD